jgi:hypothetical protein
MYVAEQVPSYACPAGRECRNLEQHVQNMTNGTENHHSTVSKTANSTKVCTETSECSVCRPGTAGHEFPGVQSLTVLYLNLLSDWLSDR